jgi:hypothetical protein
MFVTTLHSSCSFDAFVKLSSRTKFHPSRILFVCFCKQTISEKLLQILRSFRFQFDNKIT